MSKRKSKQDWLAAGLEILGAVGSAGLTIERMTAVLGVTKGSFYHHFENIQDFHRQLIVRWADQYLSSTDDLPHHASERLALLDAIVQDGFGVVTEPEPAIRLWAHEDEFVSGHVEKVDAARHQFILSVFQAVTGEDQRSRLMADLLFAFMIGSITALPRIPAERVLEMYQEFKRLYGLDSPTGVV